MHCLLTTLAFEVHRPCSTTPIARRCLAVEDWRTCRKGCRDCCSRLWRSHLIQCPHTQHACICPYLQRPLQQNDAGEYALILMRQARLYSSERGGAYSLE